MADLPKETLYEIFSRIPIECLARFRCVCKQWRKYIDDPYLENIHVKEPKPMHIALTKSSSCPTTTNTKSSKRFRQLFVLSFLRVTEDTTAGIQVKKELSKSGPLTYEPYYKIQGYCNGLITLGEKNHGSVFVVINPLTKECHELPPVENWYTIGRGQGQGLGFDNSTNTFKMVCIYCHKYRNNIGTEVHALVHVLGTDSWREIPQVSFYRIRGEAVYANGRLYWFERTSSWGIGSQLVWLDMKTEEFGVIDLPKLGEEGWFIDKLVVLNGELGFVYRIKGSSNRVVWILKRGEWMIHCVIDQSKYSENYARVVLGCWNKDGDILLTCPLGFPSFVYRLKSGSFDSLIGPEDDPGEEKAEIRMYQSSFHSIRKWH